MFIYNSKSKCSKLGNLYEKLSFHRSRALCKTKLLPHVLVDTWLLTVKPVYIL